MGLFDRIFGRSQKQERWAVAQEVRRNQGVVYFWQSTTGERHPLEAEPPNASGTDRLLLSRLQLLADEGLLVDAALPFTTIAEADHTDLQALRLNVSAGWQAEARPQAAIGRGKPDIRIHWNTPDGAFFAGFSDRFTEVACGFWDGDRAALHILPKPMLRMRQLVSEQPERFARVSDEYGFLQQVQMLAEEGTELSDQGRLSVDQQLREETYIVPRGDEVQVEARAREDGGLALSPTMPGYESFELGEQLLAGAVPATVSRRVGPDRQGRERIVHTPDVLERIEVVRASATVAPKEVARFVDDPAAFIKERASSVSTVLETVAEEMDFGRVVEQLVDLELASYGARVAGEVEFVPGPSYDAKPREDGPETRVLLERLPTPSAEDQAESEAPTQARASQQILDTASNIDELEFSVQTAQSLRNQLVNFAMPRLFRGTLRTHQQEGYVWLRNLWDAASETEYGQGGLLADEMGLGKTVQVTALLAYLHETNQLQPAAIVGPSAVTHNWADEITRFVPEIRVLLHEGSHRADTAEEIAQFDVVIVTYDVLTRDQKLFALIPFSVLVLDEAHYIKNHGAKRARACRAMQARLRLALTATPVENRLEELWGVTDFAQPGLLGSLRSFCNTFVRPIETGGIYGAFARTTLLNRLTSHYLRRTKQQALELPKMSVHVVALPMTTTQQQVYNAVLEFHQTSGRGSLAAIHDLVRVSAHPAAVEEMASVLNVEETMREILGSPDHLLAASAKFQFIFDKLDAIHEAGEKAVIFTSLRMVQPVLQMAIRHRFGRRPVTLTGSDSANRRNQEIQRFNQLAGFAVLVLSTRAVGLGVNITGANHVFHLTREWNPSKESQATARVHRIGQTRPVTVWVPIATAPQILTIDERIEQLMKQKGALAESVIRQSASMNFSEKELAVVLEGNARDVVEVEIGRQQQLDNDEQDAALRLRAAAAPLHRSTGLHVDKIIARFRQHGIHEIGASDKSVLQVLLSKPRVHIQELARDTGSNLRIVSSSIANLKHRLNRTRPVVVSDEEYVSFNVEAFELAFTSTSPLSQERP